MAYVYHMFKEHWCGDDFEYSNDMWARTYSTARMPEVPKNFFQPKADEWYTVWSHVAMNTAGTFASVPFSRQFVFWHCTKMFRQPPVSNERLTLHIIAHHLSSVIRPPHVCFTSCCKQRSGIIRITSKMAQNYRASPHQCDCNVCI